MPGVAVRMISFPFRLDPTGAAITSVEAGTDPHVDQMIAIAMLTRPGERDQVPTFGVADPAFATFQVGALQRHLIDFGPDVTITDVTVTQQREGLEQVVVDWQRNDEDTEAAA